MKAANKQTSRQTNNDTAHLPDETPDNMAEACASQAPHSATHSTHGVTRRVFAAGALAAVGSLFMEPVSGVKNTYWLPGVQKAYAYEATTVTIDSNKFAVLCCDLSRYAYDKGLKHAAYVQSVAVTVKSLYNDYKKTVYTGEDGLAVFDMQPFARTTHVEGQNGSFLEFDATVTVDASSCYTEFPRSGNRYSSDWDGPYAYHDVTYQSVHITGGTALRPAMTDRVARDSKDQWSPYFRKIAFDGWDIQTSDLEFVLSPANDATHDLECELYFPKATQYSIQPIVKTSSDSSRIGKAIADAQTISGGKGEYITAKFSKKFLLTGNVDAVTVGDTIDIVVTNPSKSGSDANILTVSTKISFSAAPCDEGFIQDNIDFPLTLGDGTIGSKSTMAASENESNIMLASGRDYGMRTPGNMKFTLPNNGWPKAIKGMNLELWMPSLPFVFRYDPLGTIMFGIDLELFNYSNAKDPIDGNNSWRYQPRGLDPTKQMENKWQKFKNFQKQYKDMRSGTKKKHKFSGFGSFTVHFQALALLKWEDDKKLYDGALEAGLGFDLSGCFTERVLIVVVPAFVTVEIGGGIDFALSKGLISDVSKLDGKIHSINNVFGNLDFTNDKSVFTMTLNGRLALTIGIGCEYVVAFGVRGSGGISFSLQWGDPKPGKHYPRQIFGANASISLWAQAFYFFKYTITFWSYSNPAIYDSDKSDNSRSMAAFANEESSFEPLAAATNEGGEYYISELAAEPALVNDSGEDDNYNLDPSKFTIITANELRNVAEVKVSLDDKSTASLATTAIAMAESASENASFEPFSITDFSSGAYTCSGDAVKSAHMDSVTAIFTNDASAVMLAAAEEGNDSGDDGYEYEWTDDHGYFYDDRSSGDAVIYELGDEGGVRPRHMNILAKNVFASPRGKFIEIGDVRYLFRIAPVLYNGVVLSRVVYQSVTNTGVSNPFPVKFDSTSAGVPRDSLFDYDFDIKIVDKDSDNPSVLLLVVSGERPNEDKTTIFEAAESTYATMVKLNWKAQAAGADRGDFVTTVYKSWSSPSYSQTSKYYAFRCPSLFSGDGVSKAAFDAIAAVDGYSHYFGSLLVDAADTKEGLLTPGLSNTAINVLHFVSNWEDDINIIDQASVSVQAGTQAVVPDSAQLATDGSGAVFAIFGYITTEGAGVHALKLSFDKTAVSGGNQGSHDAAALATDGVATGNESLQYNKLSAITSIPVINPDNTVKNLSPLEDACSLMASVSTGERDDSAMAAPTGYLALATLPSAAEIEAHVGVTTGFASFNLACISPTDVPLSRLHLRADHKYCYYPLNHDGVNGFEYDDDGNASEHKGEPAYRIMAMAQVNGVFSKPFVFAQCDNPLDSLFVVEDTNNSSVCWSSFAANHITSADDSKADIYAFDVPFLCSVATTAIAPVGGDVNPGETNDFYVTIKNTGNTVVTKANLYITDADDFVSVGEMPITLDFDQAKNSSDSGLYEDIYHGSMTDSTKANILVADDGDAVLLPGQSRTFVVKVDVPESWRGLTTKEIIVNTPSGEADFIDPATGEEVSESPRVALYESNDNNSINATIDVVADTTITVPDGSGEDSDSSDSDDNSNNNGDSDSGVGSKTTLAATGDSTLSILTPAAIALAAAGAGLIAYSARRTSLENGDPEDTNCQDDKK